MKRIAFALLLALWPCVACGDITTDLESHHILNDNAASTAVVATVGTNGTLQGGDNTSAKYVGNGNGPGGANVGMTFNGTDDRVTLASPYAAIGGTPAYTVSFWVKSSSYQATGAAVDIAGLHLGGSQIVIVYPTDDNAGNGVRVFSLLGTGIDNNAGVPALNAWHHVVLVVRSSSDAEVYVDKVSAGTTSGNLTLDTNTDFVIASRVTNAQHFAGQLADVRVYSRALTTGDIEELYEVYVTSNLPAISNYYRRMRER